MILAGLGSQDPTEFYARYLMPQLLLSLPYPPVVEQTSYGYLELGNHSTGQDIQGASQACPPSICSEFSKPGGFLVNSPLAPVVEQNSYRMYQFGNNSRTSWDSNLPNDISQTWYLTFPSSTYLNLDMNNSTSSLSSCSSTSCSLKSESFEAPATVSPPEPSITRAAQGPTSQSQSFKEAVAHCKSVKHYKHSGLKHSLDCLFNPANPTIPQSARDPVGNNKALFIEWYQGEKKGTYLDGAAEWKKMKKKEKQDWSKLSKGLRTEYDKQLKKGFIQNNSMDI
ncbi:hypothetical protein L3Y34_019386 [Caenorhabditis briggsae]|uniref:Uncharacterized protein n=1 Tax=Caenorhabditis briggsae TaxID=6238 RepID=A0AAE9IVW6_CAEBR|nr:hypothetical protein L3Y34_019386 [Caenorhabditis briggsae]